MILQHKDVRRGRSNVSTLLFVLVAHCSWKGVVPMCILYLCVLFTAVKINGVYVWTVLFGPVATGSG